MWGSRTLPAKWLPVAGARHFSRAGARGQDPSYLIRRFFIGQLACEFRELGTSACVHEIFLPVTLDTGQTRADLCLSRLADCKAAGTRGARTNRAHALGFVIYPHSTARLEEPF